MLRNADSCSGGDDSSSGRDIESRNRAATGSARVHQSVRILSGKCDHHSAERSDDSRNDLHAFPSGAECREQGSNLHRRRLAPHHDVESSLCVVRAKRLPKGELVNRALQRVQRWGAHCWLVKTKTLALSTSRSEAPLPESCASRPDHWSHRGALAPPDR